MNKWHVFTRHLISLLGFEKCMWVTSCVHYICSAILLIISTCILEAVLKPRWETQTNHRVEQFCFLHVSALPFSESPSFHPTNRSVFKKHVEKHFKGLNLQLVWNLVYFSCGGLCMHQFSAKLGQRRKKSRQKRKLSEQINVKSKCIKLLENHIVLCLGSNCLEIPSTC